MPTFQSPTSYRLVQSLPRIVTGLYAEHLNGLDVTINPKHIQLVRLILMLISSDYFGIYLWCLLWSASGWCLPVVTVVGFLKLLSKTAGNGNYKEKQGTGSFLCFELWISRDSKPKWVALPCDSIYKQMSHGFSGFKRNAGVHVCIFRCLVRNKYSKRKSVVKIGPYFVFVLMFSLWKIVNHACPWIIYFLAQVLLLM